MTVDNDVFERIMMQELKKNPFKTFHKETISVLPQCEKRYNVHVFIPFKKYNV